MKKLKVLFLLIAVAFTSVVTAQATYVKEGEIKICDNRVKPLDLGKDVVGLELTLNSGRWDRVNPADESVILEANVSNILLAVDKQPGVYVYVYTSNLNPCLPPNGKVKSTVEILETPKPISHTILLCEGQSKTLDLKTILPSTLLAKYTDIVFKDEQNQTINNGILSIANNFTGIRTLKYFLNVSPTNSYPCVDSANIFVEVTRQASVISGLTGSKNFCLNALPASVNLTHELGISAPGTWLAPSGAPAINATTGVIDLSGSGIVKGTYEYTYSFTANEPCITGNEKAKFTVNIDDDLSQEFLPKAISLCKVNNPNLVIDMLHNLGIAIPLASGTWTPDGAQPSDINVKDGLFEMADAVEGVYKYKFTVHTVSNICGLAGQSAILTINVELGGELNDGQIQICESNIPSNVTLSSYISAISTTAKWYKADGTTEIENGLVSANDLVTGTINHFIYKQGTNDCKATGNLYISIDSELTNFKDHEVKFCLTDFGSDAVNVEKVLGVVGVPGTWAAPSGVDTNYDATTHVFNGKAQGVGTYEFTFTAGNDAGCGLAGKVAKVTVIITDTLN